MDSIMEINNDRIFCQNNDVYGGADIGYVSVYL